MRTQENRAHALVTLLSLLVWVFAVSQTDGSTTGNAADELKHSVEISPISPLIRIYGIMYDYKLTPKDELVTGLVYMNLRYNIGSTNASGFLAGYRRYLWNTVHLEYQLMPLYDDYYEANEKKYYSGIDLWNEFRAGYQYDFNISKLPCYVSIQWPFGFGLYAGNKPESFHEKSRENPYFYFPPLLFIGVKF